MDDSFIEAAGDTSKIKRFLAGKVTIHQVYGWWDCCLVDDMLSVEGNRFARHYFDFGKGQYIHDYMNLLQGSLPSELHVKYNETNYRRMKKVIDRRFEEWKASKEKRRPKRKAAKKGRRAN